MLPRRDQWARPWLSALLPVIPFSTVSDVHPFPLPRGSQVAEQRIPGGTRELDLPR